MLVAFTLSVSLPQLGYPQACVDAMAALEQSVGAFAAAVGANNQFLMMRLASERETHLNTIKAHLTLHKLPPMALGSGRSSLDFKLRALLRSLFLETQSLQLLSQVCAMVRGFCTDLGVEAGIAEASGVDLKDVLPPYMTDDLEPDGGEGRQLPSMDPDGSVFPNAVWVPGLCHVAHNLTKSVDGALPGFAPWFVKFKALNSLLHHPALRKRLAGACYQGGRCEWMLQFLEKGTPAVAEWRWNSILSSLEIILSLQVVLQSGWDAVKFSERGQQREGQWEGPDDDADPIMRLTSNEFNIQQVDEAIKGNSWWLYARMLLELNNIVAAFTADIEGCPCHSWMRAAPEHAELLRNSRRALGLQDKGLDGPRHLPCPVAGLQALQLASGAVRHCFESRDDSLLARLVGNNPGATTDEELQRVMSDYSLGRMHMLSIARQKLELWTKPPWSLVSLASTDVAEARRRATEILQHVDQLPAPNNPITAAAQHRLVVRHLQNGSQAQTSASVGTLGFVSLLKQNVPKHNVPPHPQSARIS